VTEAKKRKAKRLKQAKDEAQVSPFWKHDWNSLRRF
jgi:hypothetical protein